jgi:hypothetical protein
LGLLDLLLFRRIRILLSIAKKLVNDLYFHTVMTSKKFVFFEDCGSGTVNVPMVSNKQKNSTNFVAS